MNPAVIRCLSCLRGYLTSNRLKLAFILLSFLACQLSASTPSNKSSTRIGFLLSNQLQIEITGQVTDAATGEPLAGVNIVLEGTATGEVTNNSGYYSISVPDENTVLVFSYVGYATQSVTIGIQRIINLTLTPEAQELEEAVAIGYGTIKKSDLTGAISSVKQDEIEKVAPVNVQTALQGRAAGVYVSQNSGRPGTEPVIRIRGTGTVNTHAPIYVVDGVIMDISDVRDEASTISFLNPADIARIEVLKDASATAIYGSRGANGVILITTNKGFDSSPKVTFNGQLGFTRAAPMKELLGADEYLEYVRTAYANGYNTTHPDTLPDVERTINQHAIGYNTDWMNEIMREGPAMMQNYNLSVRGGAKDARYVASFGYYNEDGILINNNYKRYSLRFNTDFKLGKFFTLGENIGIAQMDYSGVQWDDVGPVRAAMAENPLYPVLKADSLVDKNDPYYEYNKYEGEYISNAVASIQRNTDSRQILTFFGNVFAEASFLGSFRLRTSLGLNLSNSFLDQFSPKYYLSPQNSNPESIVENYLNRTRGWLWENTLTYHRILEKHEITAVAGYTSELNRYDYLWGQKLGTPSNNPELRTLDAATTNPQTGGGYDIITMISMLGRVNYSFGNRYLITASIRRDGTSKFGPDHKWGVFPSVSAGWIISNEGFFESLRERTIPLMKLRAGWGRIGNSSMSAYNTNTYVSQIASDPKYRALFDNQPYTGYYYETIGIPDLGWETVEQVNVGLDLGLLHNALTLNTDYFIKTTRDMLVNVDVPGYAGLELNNPWVNAGSVENKGFEFMLTYKGHAGRFIWDISTNVSSYRNEVLSTNLDTTSIWFPENPTITEVGYPISSFFGYVVDGIFQNEEEILNYTGPSGDPIQPNASPGDFRFKDLNGDGYLTGAANWLEEGSGDQTIIGNPHPKLIYGFTINLAYAGFDLLTFWQGVAGNKIWNNSLLDLGTLTGYSNAYRERYLDAWRGEGSSNSQPRMSTNDPNWNFRESDYFVEDGSYLRMKNIQIGYSLPVNLIDRLRISSCRIWIGGTDLLTFTSYSGNDPEVGLRDPIFSGIDYRGNYPKTRRITAGIQVEF
jgi:TonB-linked SusC/RagA family outer membrane protein